MEKPGIFDKPVAFVFKNRYHDVNCWKNLTHDLIEDLIFSGEDKSCEKILDADMPSAGVPVCVSKKKTVSWRLSNGCYVPFVYSEETYEVICRDICRIYNISPLDLRIFYEDDIEEYKARHDFETRAADSMEENSNTEKTVAEEPAYSDDSNEKETSEENDEVKKAAEKIFSDKTSGSIPVFTRREEESNVEKEKTNEENEEEDEYYFHWDDVIDYFETVKNDQATAAEAKKMSRFGIKPPSDFPYDLVYRKDNGKFSLLSGAYDGRIIASAAMIWKKEKIVYLTKKQNACEAIFREHGYKTFSNDVKGLSEALGGVF